MSQNSVTFSFGEQRALMVFLAKIVARDSGPAIEALNQLAQRFETMSGTMQGELDELRASVEALTTVRGSVEELVNGIPAMIQAAVDDAIAKGATPEQLAALDEMNATLRAQIDGVAAAVTTNTPAEDEGDAAEPEPAPVEPEPTPEPTPPADDTVPGA